MGPGVGAQRGGGCARRMCVFMVRVVLSGGPIFVEPH